MFDSISSKGKRYEKSNKTFHITKILIRPAIYWQFSCMISNTLTYLFQKIIVDMTTHWISFKIKVDVHVFAKPTGVIIPVGLGIAKGFQYNVGLDKHIFNSVNIRNSFSQECKYISSTEYVYILVQLFQSCCDCAICIKSVQIHEWKPIPQTF